MFDAIRNLKARAVYIFLPLFVCMLTYTKSLSICFIVVAQKSQNMLPNSLCSCCITPIFFLKMTCFFYKTAIAKLQNFDILSNKNLLYHHWCSWKKILITLMCMCHMCNTNIQLYYKENIIAVMCTIPRVSIVKNQRNMWRYNTNLRKSSKPENGFNTIWFTTIEWKNDNIHVENFIHMLFCDLLLKICSVL